MGKTEGRIAGLWPGSCLHAVRALKHPRWEDFDYEPLDESNTRNRFYWLGDGSTHNEKHMSGDRTMLPLLHAKRFTHSFFYDTTRSMVFESRRSKYSAWYAL